MREENEFQRGIARKKNEEFAHRFHEGGKRISEGRRRKVWESDLKGAIAEQKM
jgi:hypothetical protein